MQKVFYLLLLSVFLFSCSDSDEDKDGGVLDNYKTVKIVVTRVSNDLSLFYGGTTLTIPLDKANSQYNSKDFDQALENDGKVLLSKINEPLISKQEFILKQKSVDIQVLDIPQLEDDLEDVSLTTKIEILVNDEVVKSQTFIFDTESSNLNLVQYSKK